MTPKVKICGLKRIEDVEYVNEAGANYAGFVFFEKSHRNVTYEQARELLPRLAESIKSVAVCVSPDAEALKRMADLGFDRIQIHGLFPQILLWEAAVPAEEAVSRGSETDASSGVKVFRTGGADVPSGMEVSRTGGGDDPVKVAASRLAEAAVPAEEAGLRPKMTGAGGIPLWRAVNLSFDRTPEGDPAPNGDFGQPAKNDGGSMRPRGDRFGAAAHSVLQMAEEYPDVAGFVIDGAKYGGGRTFGWEQDEAGWRALAQNLRRIADGRGLILAGGLTVQNVSQGIRIFEPDIVDVSSGVETDGVKDREKIHQFIREVRGK